MGRPSAMLPSLFVVLLLVPLAGAGHGSEVADDWSTLHGDAGRSGSRGTVEGPGTGETVWRFLTGTIEAVPSPAVAYGRVYIGASDGNMYALDAWTGEKVWAYEIGGDLRSAAAVAGGVVYVPSRDGFLYAVDAENGTLRWRTELGDWPRTTPTIYGGVLYVGSPGGVVYALDADSGEEIWSTLPAGDRKTGRGPGIGSSIIYLDGRLFLGSSDGHVYALNATDGSLVWELRLRGSAGRSVATDGTQIFAYGSYGRLYSLLPDAGTVRWTFDVPNAMSPSVHDGTVFLPTADRLYALNASHGGLKWAVDAKMSVTTHLAVTDSTIFTVDRGGVIAARDVADGSLHWKRAIAAFIPSSPVVVDGMLYVGSSQYWVFALDAGAGAEQMPSATRAPDPQGRDTPTIGIAVLGPLALAMVLLRTPRSRRRA